MKKVNELVRKNWVYVFGALLAAGFLALYFGQGYVLGATTQDGQKKQIMVESQGTGALVNNLNTVSRAAPKAADKNIIKITPNVQTTVPASNQIIVTPSLPPVQLPATPVVEKDTVKLAIDGLGSYTVELKKGDTAFDILVRTSKKYGFILEYKSYDWGKMITKIGTRKAAGTYYWAFYYNGAYATVGADAQKLIKNDVTEWRYESWE